MREITGQDDKDKRGAVRTSQWSSPLKGPAQDMALEDSVHVSMLQLCLTAEEHWGFGIYSSSKSSSRVWRVGGLETQFPWVAMAIIEPTL